MRPCACQPEPVPCSYATPSQFVFSERLASCMLVTRRARTSVRLRHRRSIRPAEHWNYELTYGARSTQDVLLKQQNRGSTQIFTPSRALWNVKHQVGQVVAVVICEVRFLGHHVAHGSRL